MISMFINIFQWVYFKQKKYIFLFNYFYSVHMADRHLRISGVFSYQQDYGATFSDEILKKRRMTIFWTIKPGECLFSIYCSYNFTPNITWNFTNDLISSNFTAIVHTSPFASIIIIFFYWIFCGKSKWNNTFVEKKIY